MTPDNIEIQPAPANGEARRLVVAYSAGQEIHRDVFNVYGANARLRFLEEVAAYAKVDAAEFAAEWNVKLCQLADEADRRAAAEAAQQWKQAAGDRWEPSSEAKVEAEKLLVDADLLAKIVDVVNALGVVGERPLVGLGYLVTVSRLLPKPLCLIIKGDPSSGKSHIARTLLRVLPPDTFVDVTDVTANALYYLDGMDLQHKLLVLGERRRQLSPEAVDSTKPLRELIEDGRISKMLPVKTADGSLVTRKVEVQGPAAVIETCSHDSVALEDRTRQIEAWTNDTEQQSRSVLQFFAQQAAGKISPPDTAHVEAIRALQTLLEPAPTILVPYAEQIEARFPARTLECRRAFPRLLGLIEASALLHQRQRQRKGDAIVASPDDYEIAVAFLRPWLRARVGSGVPPTVAGVWEAIRQRADTFSSTDVARELGKPPCSVWRALRVLAEAGALEQTQTEGRKKYFRVAMADWQPGDVDLPADIFHACSPLKD